MSSTTETASPLASTCEDLRSEIVILRQQRDDLLYAAEEAIMIIEIYQMRGSRLDREDLTIAAEKLRAAMSK